jgi:hypothetical protein
MSATTQRGAPREEREPMPNENYDWDEARERLRKDADEGFPPSWQPENPDDEILGTVVAVNPAAPTRQYGNAPVVQIVDPVGVKWSVWLFHKVLRQNFIRQRVAVGEVVLIRYLGKVYPEGGGNAYDNYAVVVDRPVSRGDVDWDAIARRYQDDAGDLDEPQSRRSEAEPPHPADDDIPF